MKIEKNKITTRKKGQVLLITVLILTVAITVALSLIGRSTTDIGITGQTEEAARAFNAAEAGIEYTLKAQVSSSGTIQKGVTFTTTVETIAGNTQTYQLPSTISEGDMVSIWMTVHNEDESLSETDHYCKNVGECQIDVCWKHEATTPAVEVLLYYKDAGVYQVFREAYDPDVGRAANNKFTSPVTDANAGCGATANMYRQTVTLPVGIPLLLRVRPYYSETTISVSPVGGRTLPSQGIEVSSVGKTDNGVTRKIVVKRQFEAPSAIFDYSLYSQGSVTHN